MPCGYCALRQSQSLTRRKQKANKKQIKTSDLQNRWFFYFLWTVATLKSQKAARYDYRQTE
jgi:hypothetical protein